MPSRSVRPRGDRNSETRTINLVFTVEEGQRAYIERINIRGNTAPATTLSGVNSISREGDAYNRALIDRAERRLKNLNYFKTVKITNEPGSAPDRVVLNVDVEEQSTGEFSIAGGYSTSDGVVAEVSVGERNLLGRGQTAQVRPSHMAKARAAWNSRSSSRICSATGSRSGSICSPSRLTAIVVLRLPTANDRRRVAASGFSLREDLAIAAALFGLPAADRARPNPHQL